ncbi:MAG: tetratricopeptide repeat protein [Bergeyella sp.]|nr:tetratricopeptide repeat protein [Bergeyella sp.]
MKKTIYLVLISLLFVSCVAKKKQRNNTRLGLKPFYSYYNTLFNGQEALHLELDLREKQFRDNFYAPYIPLFPGETLSLDTEGSSSNHFSSPRNSPKDKRQVSALEISERKALKAISRYSVQKNGVERNKRIFDAHLLLSYARLLQGKYVEALDALNYLFEFMKKDKNIPLAKIYMARIYTKMEDYFRAGEIFRELGKQPLSNSQAKLYSAFYAEMLLLSGRYKEAADELKTAFALNKKRKLRSRIAFLRGQVLYNLGKREEARESFAKAYRYTDDFDFEVKSYLWMVKCFDPKKDDYELLKKHTEKMSRKGIYGSRKNEFYYALGRMAKAADKSEEAQEYFRKSLLGGISDPQIRGLSYYEIGKNYFDRDDFIAAGIYYDSAIAVMSDKPTRDELTYFSKNLKKLTKNYYLIKKNDSILALTKMSDIQKVQYFQKFISRIKEKEEKEALEQRRKERSKGYDTGDFSANSLFAGGSPSGLDSFKKANYGNKKNSFYFSNLSTVGKGISDFRRIWKDRSLKDNWRYVGANVSPSAIVETKSSVLGLSNVKDPRRLEPAFYIEKIPTDPQIIKELKRERDTATVGLAKMYEMVFFKTPLATKTLYDLVDTQPEEDIKLQALHQIFVMNYEKNPPAGKRAKDMILSQFPDSPHATFVMDPKSSTFSAGSSEVEQQYHKAYDLYTQDRYVKSVELIEATIKNNTKDPLVPKFLLLKAFNTGKALGKEEMIPQLEQIVLNYPNTQEGHKAEDVLRHIHASDSFGNQPADKDFSENDNTIENLEDEALQDTDEGALESTKNNFLFYP